MDLVENRKQKQPIIILTLKRPKLKPTIETIISTLNFHVN